MPPSATPAADAGPLQCPPGWGATEGYGPCAARPRHLGPLRPSASSRARRAAIHRPLGGLLRALASSYRGGGHGGDAPPYPVRAALAIVNAVILIVEMLVQVLVRRDVQNVVKNAVNCIAAIAGAPPPAGLRRTAPAVLGRVLRRPGIKVAAHGVVGRVVVMRIAAHPSNHHHEPSQQASRHRHSSTLHPGRFHLTRSSSTGAGFAPCLALHRHPPHLHARHCALLPWT